MRSDLLQDFEASRRLLSEDADEAIKNISLEVKE